MIAFTIEPSVCSLSLKSIVFEVALVVFKEFLTTMMFDNEVLIVKHRSGRVFRRNPFIVFSQLFSKFVLKKLSFTYKILHFFYLGAGIAFLIQ